MVRKPSKSTALHLIYAALERFCKSEGSRETLPADAEFPIVASVLAEAGGVEVAFDLAGDLSIGPDIESGHNSNPHIAHLSALILCQVPGTRRAALLDSIRDHFLKHERLPDCDLELKRAVSQMLGQLRSQKTITRKGAVKFVSLG
jgi:hypothetical protein